jgi:hypothetical protein
VWRLALVKYSPHTVDPRQGVALDVDQERPAVRGYRDCSDQARLMNLLGSC